MHPNIVFMKFILHIKRGGTLESWATDPKVPINKGDQNKIARLIEHAESETRAIN
jgi:hypothetical protein